MNRIDRLFAILLLLQRKHRVRAADLAARFEVSERTIYRDMAALNEMGVPIVSLPSQGYELMDGYSLPPLTFTIGEASTLFLGASMLAAQASGDLADQARHALDKIAAILPRPTRQQVDQLTAAIQFYAERISFDLDQPHLQRLRVAIQERRAVRLRYHSYSGNQITERDVEPHQLTYADGSWYVTGFCRLRQALRSFRLDRIDRLDLTTEPFTPQPIDPPAPDLIDVRVRFAAHMLRWVRERQHYALIGEEQMASSADAVLHYRVHRLDEMRAWLLSWGAAAEVLEPQSLRADLRREAIALVQILT